MFKHRHYICPKFAVPMLQVVNNMFPGSRLVGGIVNDFICQAVHNNTGEW